MCDFFWVSFWVESGFFNPWRTTGHVTKEHQPEPGGLSNLGRFWVSIWVREAINLDRLLIAQRQKVLFSNSHNSIFIYWLSFTARSSDSCSPSPKQQSPWLSLTIHDYALKALIPWNSLQWIEWSWNLEKMASSCAWFICNYWRDAAALLVHPLAFIHMMVVFSLSMMDQFLINTSIIMGDSLLLIEEWCSLLVVGHSRHFLRAQMWSNGACKKTTAEKSMRSNKDR